jgi:hypothetical protein
MSDKSWTFTAIRFIIVFQPSLSTRKYSLSVRYSHQNLLHMSNPYHSYYMPRPSHTLELIILITLREEHKLWIYSLRSALIQFSSVQTLAHKSTKSAHVQNTCKIKRIIILAYFGGTWQLVEQQTVGLSLLLVQGVDDIDVRQRQCFEMWHMWHTWHMWHMWHTWHMWHMWHTWYMWHTWHMWHMWRWMA